MEIDNGKLMDEYGTYLSVLDEPHLETLSIDNHTVQQGCRLEESCPVLGIACSTSLRLVTPTG